MGDAFCPTLPADAGGKSAQISGLYLGVIIIVTCAFSITPIELFIVEVWPRHGIFSLLLFIVPLIAGWVFARHLPDRYYRVKPCESSERVYERLGIRFFKRFAPNGDYINNIIRRSDTSYRAVRDEESIVRFEARTQLAEKCHIAGLWLSLPCSVYALLLGWNEFALWLLLPNVPFHIYPVLLQRYNRTRILKVLNRGKRKS